MHLPTMRKPLFNGRGSSLDLNSKIYAAKLIFCKIFWGAEVFSACYSYFLNTSNDDNM